MAGQYYVYSTLTSDVEYALWSKPAGDLPIIERTVKIKGGANLANARLVTPYGVATSVSAEELDLLNGNEVFTLHKKNGFITVSEKSEDPEKVATDMTGRDASAPLVPQDFTEEEEPKVGKKGK